MPKLIWWIIFVGALVVNFYVWGDTVKNCFFKFRRRVIWPLGWKVRYLRDRLARWLGGYRGP